MDACVLRRYWSARNYVLVRIDVPTGQCRNHRLCMCHFITWQCCSPLFQRFRNVRVLWQGWLSPYYVWMPAIMCMTSGVNHWLRLCYSCMVLVLFPFVTYSKSFLYHKPSISFTTLFEIEFARWWVRAIIISYVLLTSLQIFCKSSNIFIPTLKRHMDWQKSMLRNGCRFACIQSPK